jgi:peroxiredoxin
MIALLLLSVGAAPHTITPWALYDREYEAFLKNRDPEILIRHASRYPNHATAVLALLHVAKNEEAWPGPAKKAMEMLSAYPKRAVMAEAAPHVVHLDHPATRELLRKAGEENPVRRTRALVWRAVLNHNLSEIESLTRSMKGGFAGEDQSKQKWYRDRIAEAGQRAAEARRRMAAPELKGALPDLSPGSPAPDTPTAGLDGQRVSVASLKGKVVVLEFWLPTCPPCLRSIPRSNALIKEMKGRPFVHVGVCVQGPEALRAFLARNELPWAHWLGEGGSRFMEDWDPRSYPTFHVIDHEGVIRLSQSGFDPAKDEIAPLVRKLVKKAEAARAGRVEP